MTTQAASSLSWLLTSFVRDTPGVVHAQTMSSDGMHLAASEDMSEVQCDQFAAISSGMISLGDSAREVFAQQPLVRTMVETESGWIVLTRVSAMACLAVITDATADLGLVGYELSLLVEQAGDFMSPEEIRAMQNTLSL